MKKISVVGLGYIGLPTAILAAQRGYIVSGFDTNIKKIKAINKGDGLIQEPELKNRLNAVLSCNRFKAHKELQSADCFIIAVPTPFKEQKKADLSFVFDATKKIASKLVPGNLVILESTVPVGTTQKIKSILEKESGLKAKQDFYLAHCPERVLPGNIFKELVVNDRIIGGICKKSNIKAKKFYSAFTTGNCNTTNDGIAEMAKLIENSSRDIQIALANQIASMCEEVNLDPFEVISLANKHPRVNILHPGCGVGGHCIAVDPWFLIESFSQNTHLLKSARLINDTKPKQVINTVTLKSHEFKKEKKRKPRVLILGLTFKPNVDDLRESPALEIAKSLDTQKNYLDLFVCEPNIKKHTLEAMKFLNPVDLQEGLDLADIVVVLVKHSEFKKITLQELDNKIIIDTCGLQHTIKQNQQENVPARSFQSARLGNSTTQL
jgi:UDP-N-acetyl-D-mannosaminuronic acid dehydrogenase